MYVVHFLSRFAEVLWGGCVQIKNVFINFPSKRLDAKSIIIFSVNRTCMVETLRCILFLHPEIIDQYLHECLLQPGSPFFLPYPDPCLIQYVLIARKNTGTHFNRKIDTHHCDRSTLTPRLHPVFHSGQEHAHRWLGDGVHNWRPAHEPSNGPQPGHCLLLPPSGQER